MTATKSANIGSALLNAQREMGPLLKNASNPHFKSKYADLSQVIETITEPFNKNGLVFVQRLESVDGAPLLSTDIIHAETGERITSTVPLTCKDPNNPQAVGAAITYMRRFSLMAMAGIAAEDDDGHAATKPPKPREAPPAAPQTTESDDSPVVESFDLRLEDAVSDTNKISRRAAFGKLYKEAIKDADVRKIKCLVMAMPTYQEAENIMSAAFDQHQMFDPSWNVALKARVDAPAEFVDVGSGEIVE
jgi:hypothetical protein